MIPIKTIYKTILIIPVIFFILPLTAAYPEYGITLQWDASNDAIAGYRLYGRRAGRPYNFDEFWCQTDSLDTECAIGELNENTTYFLVVRAFDEHGNESTNSNEVRYRYGDPVAANVPANSGSGGSSGCFIGSLAVQ